MRLPRPLAGALWLAAIASLAGCPAQKAASGPLGEAHLTRHQGGVVDGASLRGKVVVVNFWATWCAPCVAEIPQLVQVAQEMEREGGVLLAVNQDSGEPSQVHDTVEEFFFTHPSGLRPYVVYGEEGFSLPFKVQGLPTTYVLDAQGRETGHFVGGLTAESLRQAVARARAAR